MAETATVLARRMALGDMALVPGGQPGDATIELLAPRARYVLRLAPSFLPNVGDAAGFTLDLAINRCGTAGERTAMRLGPDEWLLRCPEAASAQVARDIETVLAGLHHACTDVSHRHVAFSVNGPASADVINAGCPLDLGLAAFPAGSATRTLLGKAEILLVRPTEAPVFEIECARSFAGYVRDFLLEATHGVRPTG